MSKSVLLVSYHFAPQNTIGAVRPTKLAKFLTRMGYEVTVLCGKGLDQVRDPLLAHDLTELKDVHMVREHSLLRWWKERALLPETQKALTERAVLPEKALSEEAMAAASVQAKPQQPATLKKSVPVKTTPSLQKRLLNTLYLWLYDRADKAFARACFKELYGMGKHFDVVISTYGPLSVHTVARKAKRWRLADSWIADFRDEASVPFAWQKERLKRYLRGVRKYADAITSVSAGYMSVMGLEAFGQTIHNGFDAEDISGLTFPPRRRDKLCFIHCGQMYGAQRDLSPFFRALRELIDEGTVDAARVELVYAGRDTGGFVDQATAAGLGDCLRGYGFLPRDESLQLQKASHVLLLAAWNFQDRLGNLPGKFLEYLMLDMPVLCCVAGNAPNSEIAAIIRRTNVGLCYEQANTAADYPRLKAYVHELYNAFAAGRQIPFNPNPEEVAGFAYVGVADAFARIIDNV